MKILAALLALCTLSLVSCANGKCPFAGLVKKKDCCSSGHAQGATKSCCAH